MRQAALMPPNMPTYSDSGMSWQLRHLYRAIPATRLIGREGPEAVPLFVADYESNVAIIGRRGVDHLRDIFFQAFKIQKRYGVDLNP